MKVQRILTAITLLLALLAASSAEAAGRQLLRHRLTPLTGTLQAVDRLPATNRLQAAICLPPRNAAALTNLIQQLYDPASPRFRHYLTPEEFTEKFGPTREDYDAVVAYAQQQGLNVIATHRNRMLVDVDGATADFERAFNIALRVYRHPRENRAFHAPDTVPSIALSVPVLSVCGLDNYAVPRPAGLRPAAAAQAAPMAGSGPSGSFMGYDFRKAYAPGVTLTGAGQSVGLLQFDGYFASDIAAYVTQAGLPGVPLQNVLINGYSGNAGVNNTEVALDIEMAISMAPGLDRVLVYEGSITTPPISILNRMATDNAAKQLSASWTWGTLEPGTEAIFQQFAAQGQSYFNASGDDDAYTGRIDAPADNPYITIVGGTELTTGASGTWSSETVWNWNDGTGSGGGISTTYTIPSWQQGISMTANHGSTTRRNIPDVALTADSVWVIYNNGSSGAFGGTSAASPLWAGFAALINQQAVARGLPTVGFLNPAVYAIGASSSYATAFHDITTGNNTSTVSPTNFQAVPGYDLCTGWGTPNGQPLIDALTTPPDPLDLAPAAGFTAVGPVGGPFNISAQSYVLTNSGDTSLEWSCATTSAWLTASAYSGSLPAGAASTVSVMLHAAASNLSAGIYTATLRFTNLNTAAARYRVFTLRIGQPLVENGGFETGNFDGWTQSGNTAATTVSSTTTYLHSGSYGARLGPTGSLGYLGQALATVPGQNYLLSFWLNCASGGTPNSFQATWNGATVFSKANLGAIGWTNVQLVVSASNTTSTLQFGFRDDPSYLGLDDVTLTPISGTNIPPLLTLTVQSAQGGAAPGSTTAFSGTTLSERIVNSPVINGATQHVCTGASVAGNLFTQNSPTNVTLTLTNHATLTWAWQTQYRLTTAVSGTGTVTPGGWQIAGNSVVLTATAGAGTHFVSWSGTTAGCLIAGSVLTAPMTQARSITATFAAGAPPVISGKITNSKTKAGVAGVTIRFSNSGGTATTDTSGNYSITVPYGWTGTATPSNTSGGAFSPTLKSYSKLTSSKTGQSFSWIPPPVISGTVTRSGTKTGAAGIAIVFSGVGTNTTDASGNYSMTVPYNWTGTARPSVASGGTFSPAYKSYSKVTSDKTKQAYVWTAPATLAAPQAMPVATVSPAPEVLLRTTGFARWSGADAGQVGQEAELLSIAVDGGAARITLPVAVATPDDLSATVAIEPVLQEVAGPAGERAVVIRNLGGAVTLHSLLLDASVIGTVLLVPSDNAIELTWDLTLLRP
jgi:hypothetical protein